jgi:hypothetical protein
LNDYFTRGDRLIAPQVVPDLRSEGAHFLYFEVYGLTKDDVGGTDYAISITFESESSVGSKYSLRNLLSGRQLPGQRLEHGVRLMVEGSGISSTETSIFELETLDVTGTIPSRIVIEVLDRVSNRKTTNSLNLNPPLT